MLLRSFVIFTLAMSRHRKGLRGALGHGLYGLCVNPSLLDKLVAKRLNYYTALCCILLAKDCLWKSPYLT